MLSIQHKACMTIRQMREMPSGNHEAAPVFEPESDQVPVCGRWCYLFAHPLTGSIFSITALLGFLGLCIMLPMVGPSGAATSHAAANHVAFITVLTITLLAAVTGTVSLAVRRRCYGGPAATIPPLVTVCSLLLAILLFSGQLAR